MHVFYTPDIAGEQHTLDEQESKHCVQVLRMGVGDEALLLDGRGSKYISRITSATKKQVTLTIVEKLTFSEPAFKLHLAVAPTKNIDRFEWFLEKATEIGLWSCTPIICARSERRVIKTDRLEKVITAAVKQSMAVYHPGLRPGVDLSSFLRSSDLPVNRFIAHCADGERSALKTMLQPGNDCLILVGPEGDFSPSEVALALECGFKPITLGDSRLRTETAALAACFEANYLNR